MAVETTAKESIMSSSLSGYSDFRETTIDGQ